MRMMLDPEPKKTAQPKKILSENHSPDWAGQENGDED